MYNIGIKVHNRFDFDVRNAITGEPNPDYIGYYAENIVLLGITEFSTKEDFETFKSEL